MDEPCEMSSWSETSGFAGSGEEVLSFPDFLSLED